MPAYNYVALDHVGHEKKGVLEAESPLAVRRQLRRQGLTPLDVMTTVQKQSRKRQHFFQRKSIKVQELALFTRQLATLLSAGLPLEEALLACAQQTEKDQVQSIIMGVRARVLEGHSLAKGLADFSTAFPEVYRATIAAGEQSGHLHTVLERLADYTEKRQAMRQKIQQALIYPLIMSLVAIAIVGFLLIFVVPKMIAVFSDSGQALPLLTQLLLLISHSLQHYGWIVLLLLMVAIILFKRALQREQFRYRYHSLLLKIPFLAKMLQVINTARFARTLGILTAAGVPVLEALRVSLTLISLLPLRQAVHEATKRVREGMPISRALKQTGYFQPMMIHLIANGEASGQLEMMLTRAADTQEQNVSVLIESGLSLFEPLMIMLMGGIVLFIVLAILLPIFEMNQLVG